MARSADPVHVTAARIPALDGVRGVAILVVLIHNASFILGHSDRTILKLLTAATRTGWIGVQLFFVLSGFLITGILLDTRRSEGYFRNFYVRRVLRIFPLYYGFLIVAVGIAPFFASPEWASAARGNQLQYWTYTSNLGFLTGPGIPGLTHFWSLAVEEQFYLLWPLVVYALPRGRLAWLCLVTLVGAPLLRVALYIGGFDPGAAYSFTPLRMDALAAGALLAVLMTEESGRAWITRRMPFVGGVALAVLPVFVFINHGFNGEDWPVEIAGQTISIALFSWLIHASVTAESNLQAVARTALGAGWLRFLGKYSYAMYVFHWPLHMIAAPHLAAAVNGADTLWRAVRWAGYVGSVGLLSTMLALASWKLLEKPFLDLKARWAPRHPPTLRTAISQAPVHTSPPT